VIIGESDKNEYDIKVIFFSTEDLRLCGGLTCIACIFDDVHIRALTLAVDVNADEGLLRSASTDTTRKPSCR